MCWMVAICTSSRYFIMCHCPPLTENVSNIDKADVCTVDGGWSDWGACDTCDCSQSDCIGSSYRHHTCTNPPPQYRGRNCTGDSAQFCHEFPVCPTKEDTILGLQRSTFIGIIAGGAAAVAITVAIAVWWFYRRRRQNSSTDLNFTLLPSNTATTA